ncbi:unnamed protein product [Lampetra fluviatilis]
MITSITAQGQATGARPNELAPRAASAAVPAAPRLSNPLPTAARGVAGEGNGTTRGARETPHGARYYVQRGDARQSRRRRSAAAAAAVTAPCRAPARSETSLLKTHRGGMAPARPLGPRAPPPPSGPRRAVAFREERAGPSARPAGRPSGPARGKRGASRGDGATRRGRPTERNETREPSGGGARASSLPVPGKYLESGQVP